MVGELEDVQIYNTADGVARASTKVIGDDVGVDLRWATAQVTKSERRQPQDEAF